MSRRLPQGYFPRATLDLGNDPDGDSEELERIEAIAAMTPADDPSLHARGHVFGRWLTCLRCGRDIAEKCSECRRLHARRYHVKEGAAR